MHFPNQKVKTDSFILNFEEQSIKTVEGPEFPKVFEIDEMMNDFVTSDIHVYDQISNSIHTFDNAERKWYVKQERIITDE